MTVLTIATVVLALVAIVATYFVARASLAIVDMREQTTVLRKQGKEVLRQAQRTERTANRIMDKLYRQHKDIEKILDPLLRDAEVRRAIRKVEGRRR